MSTLRLLATVVLFLSASLPLRAAPVLGEHLARVVPAELVAGAESFGAIRDDLPVAPILKGTEQIGWVFVTSDFVGTTGYSGKPIHTMVAIDDAARVIGVALVKPATQDEHRRFEEAKARKAARLELERRHAERAATRA